MGSTHSAGNVYMDESDSDSDGSSSYESFGSTGSDEYLTDDSDDEAGNRTAEVENKTKGNKTPKKKKGESPMQKYRKQARKRNFAPAAIPEVDEDDEFEDISDNESDNNSAPGGYGTPAALRKQANLDRFNNDAENFDSGYSSDSALVRKRMA